MSRTEPESYGRHDIAHDPRTDGYRCIVCGKTWPSVMPKQGQTDAYNEECPGTLEQQAIAKANAHDEGDVFKATMAGTPFKPEKQSERDLMALNDSDVPYGKTNPPLIGEFQDADISLEPGAVNYALRKGETKEDVMDRAAAEVAKYGGGYCEDEGCPRYGTPHAHFTDDDVRKALQVLRSNGLITVARQIALRRVEMREWLKARNMPELSDYIEYKETSGPNFGKPYQTERLVGVPVRLLNELVKALGL